VASKLKQGAGEMKVPPFRMNLSRDIIAHVKYWAPTKDGVLMRMATHDIPDDFSHRTKLVIECSTRIMSDDTGHEVKRFTVADLNDRGRFYDLRKRLA
jgi:hypothetical protein